MKKDVKQVLVSGSWYIIGNFMIKAVTFLSVSVFTRIMTLEDYGRYCTYLVYESIMTAIMGLGFAKTISVAKFEFKNKFNDYVASLAGYQTVIAVFLGVVGLNICWLTNYHPGIFAAMWIASYGNGIFQLVEQRFIIENRYVRYIGMTFLYNIPQILLSICLILFWKGQSTYIERLIGHVIPLIVLLALCLVYIMKKGSIHSKYLKYSLRLGIPTIFTALSATVLTQSDRVLIGFFAGEDKVGIYSGVGTIGSILYIVMLSMQNVWTRIFMEHFTGGQYSQIRRKMKSYVCLFMLAVFGIMAVGKELSRFFLAEEYWVGAVMIVPLCLGWFLNFLGCIMSEIEYAGGKVLYLTLGMILGALINIGTNLYFIPIYGYEAAAYTTSLSYLCVFIFHLLVERKVCRTNSYSISFLGMTVLIMITYSLCIQALWNNFWLRGLVFTAYAVGVILLYIISTKKVIPHRRR
ncbi:MAG: oligosaccharide flippase family protein [Lachnospiraceae bacterium]